MAHTFCAQIADFSQWHRPSVTSDYPDPGILRIADRQYIRELAMNTCQILAAPIAIR